ncbi:MAG: ABC transporter ATP-binding protein [Pseudomonadota bacterium]|nr:ABC transporter ATP-binding protein [Pseudomonadota bacterium]
MKESNTKLQINGITLKLDNEEVIKNLSLSVSQNEITAILGASASGKSSLLRVIAGFEKIDAGEVILNQKVVNNEQKTVPPELRNVGIIFQDLALFPYLNVKENICFGMSNMTNKEKDERCDELKNLLNISEILEKFPHQISGGQQQRVAIARALAPKPQLLLLDEPFSALDEELKEQLVQDVKKILKTEKITTILITHNIKEAFGISDKIAFLSDKKIVQYDTPYNIYHKPLSREIANFCGISSYVKGKVLDKNHVSTTLGNISGQSTEPYALGKNIEVLIRPDDIIHDDDATLTAKVVEKIFHGSDFLYKLELNDGQTIFCYKPSDHNHSLNEVIGITVEIDHLILFDT